MNALGVNETEVVAEVGINHNGSLDELLELVALSAAAGVNAVKFQYRNPRRAYANRARELGDEMVLDAVHRTYIPPADLCRAATLAESCGMRVGISFFTVEDIDDILNVRSDWDFFKVPSAELLNQKLISAFCRLNRPIFISTGAHDEQDVVGALSSIPDDVPWTPFHCVSNYPTETHNAKLGYITHLRKLWKRPVGFSSHDVDWRMCLIAATLGAQIVERHVTLDKGQEGLDHSTSSTPQEFAELIDLLKSLPLATAGDGPRVVNQGERLNLQNLGRSLYLNVPKQAGETLDESDLVYASPRIGGVVQPAEVIGKVIPRSLEPGSLVTAGIFGERERLTGATLTYCDDHRVGIPVRPHDQELLLNRLPLSTVEYHLSFGDLNVLDHVSVPGGIKHASVHLPDYISPTRLIDPFSSENAVADQSLHVIDKVLAFARRLQESLGETVPVVGSFSSLDRSQRQYLQPLADLVEVAAEREVRLMPQWLPPIAWYFGGSVRLKGFCSPDELADISDHGIVICLDTAHLAMSCHGAGRDFDAVLREALPLAGHIHLGDAAGIDGEGVALGSGTVGQSQFLPKLLDEPMNKIVEVWQGHLDEGTGFVKELHLLHEGFAGE